MWEFRNSALSGRVHQSELTCTTEVCAFTFHYNQLTSSPLHEDSLEVTVIVKDTTLNYSARISKIL